MPSLRWAKPFCGAPTHRNAELACTHHVCMEASSVSSGWSACKNTHRKTLAREPVPTLCRSYIASSACSLKLRTKAYEHATCRASCEKPASCRLERRSHLAAERGCDTIQILACPITLASISHMQHLLCSHAGSQCCSSIPENFSIAMVQTLAGAVSAANVACRCASAQHTFGGTTHAKGTSLSLDSIAPRILMMQTLHNHLSLQIKHIFSAAESHRCACWLP